MLTQLEGLAEKGLSLMSLLRSADGPPGAQGKGRFYPCSSSTWAWGLRYLKIICAFFFGQSSLQYQQAQHFRMAQYIFPGGFCEPAYLSSFSSCTLMLFPEVISKSHTDSSIPKEHKLTDLICTDISKNQHKGSAQRI